MKKFTKTGSLFLTLVLVLSFTFTGFVTKSVKSSGALGWDASKKDKVVLSVINNYYTAGEKKLAVDYMKLHPETEVVVDILSDNDAYNANLKTKFETDKNLAPDIVHGNFAQSVIGSWTAAYDKGIIQDLSPLLNETNPYNNNKKVSEAFNKKDIALAISNANGKLGFMPFDWVGVGVYYNKTVFNKLGIKIPKSMEEWLVTCKKLKASGYDVPIGASGVAGWVQGMYADVAYRKYEPQLVSLPGDAAYDAATMKGNTTLKYSPTDPLFDQYSVFNDEKVKAFLKKNTFNNPMNKLIWTTFGQLAENFQKNWLAPDDTQVVTDFETQASPMMINGSWMVGKLVDDVNKLPKNKQFEWGTFKIPGYAKAPKGLEAKIRSLYVFGNAMSIVPKDDKDHMARVEDIYKYWMSPKVAQMMYEETLANGNYVQGPPAIIGVKLSAANNAKLDGFKSEGNMKGDFGAFVGQTAYLASDKPIYDDIVNKLSQGKITIDKFMVQLNKIAMKALNDTITRNGYDLNPKTKDTAKK